MINQINILLRSGYIQAPVQLTPAKDNKEALATVLMNLEYYGFALSPEAFRAVRTLSADALGVWWVHLEKELKAVTGDDRNIDDFVVKT